MSKRRDGRPGFLHQLRETVKNVTFGMPDKPEAVKKTKTAVLGAVEQNYGIYQVPSFREEVTTMWNDPLLKEAITMFAEQVVSTGYFLTFNPDYKLVLNGKTAIEAIHEWCDANHIDLKLPEIAIELKAFGNSFWRVAEKLGFVKIPIESVWHAVRVDPELPLQEKYNLQLVPIYGGKILEEDEYIHFRVGVTGYHAPFGQGVIYSLLCRPIDSAGNVAPSIYDIRLNMRASLNEGFLKFSFGNELWALPEMSNEDFQATDDSGKTISQHISEMSSTGNRIVTNTNGKISIAVPERTQSYDEFIKQMRDEFFMALADPSLKLGLEQGFTKATSVTASEVYKYKIALMRKSIKIKFEDIFVQILNSLGYEGQEAGIVMNFGPEESAIYNIADIFAAEDRDIITANESRKLLSTYHKWDIQGDVKDGDKLNSEKRQASGDGKAKTVPLKPSQTEEQLAKAQETD